jgi:predicted nucleic acid-binding protein
VSTHLAETSVLTRLSVAAVRGALQPFIDAVALARCTLTDLELGFSASSASDWDRLQAVLTTLTPVEVTPAVISRAKTVQRMLAAGGLKGRKVPDLIIAAAAELAGLTVLHYDQDFELIASVTSQPYEWVVPRGSIDLPRKCRLRQASLRCAPADSNVGSGSIDRALVTSIPVSPSESGGFRLAARTRRGEYAAKFSSRNI